MSNSKPRQNGCLICGNDTKGGSRGLCQPHYRDFKAKVDLLESEEDVLLFEQQLIAKDQLRPRQKGGRPKTPSPFDELFDRFRNRSEQKQTDEDAQRDAERQAILAAETEAAYARKMAEKKNERSDKRKRG